MKMIGLKPVISVVLPAWNEEDRIQRVLGSLAAQKISVPFEVIVVDNNSTDGTAALAQEYSKQFLSLRVVHEPHQSIAAARNRGFLEARAEIVASTDADTILPPDWLATIYTTLSSNPNAVGLVGLYRFGDKSAVFNAFTYSVMLLADCIQRVIGGVFALRGGNSAVLRREWEAVGGFDRNIGNLEDVELSMRLKSRGQILFLPKLVVTTTFRRFEGRLVTQIVKKLQAYKSLLLKDIRSIRDPGNFR